MQRLQFQRHIWNGIKFDETFNVGGEKKGGKENKIEVCAQKRSEGEKMLFIWNEAA